MATFNLFNQDQEQEYYFQRTIDNDDCQEFDFFGMNDEFYGMNNEEHNSVTPQLQLQDSYITEYIQSNYLPQLQSNQNSSLLFDNYDSRTNQLTNNNDNTNNNNSNNNDNNNKKYFNEENKAVKNCYRDLIQPFIKSKQFKLHKALFQQHQIDMKEYQNFCNQYFPNQKLNKKTYESINQIKQNDEYFRESNFLRTLIIINYNYIIHKITKENNSYSETQKEHQRQWFNNFLNKIYNY